MPNKFMIASGVFSMIQAIAQTVCTSLAIAQHFCVIDFLQRFPLLVVIKVLYFTNFGNCNPTITVGNLYEELADQAFIMITKQSFTATRTFWFNCINLGLGVVWAICSYLLIRGGSLKHHSHSHWPWLVSTMIVTISDIVSFVCFVNDSYGTKRLSDIVQKIGAKSGGLGTNEVDTQWVSWSMAIVYSRFGIGVVANIMLINWGVVDCTRFNNSVTSSEAERNRRDSMYSVQPTISPHRNAAPGPAIPRPGFRRSFRDMKTILFNEAAAQRTTSTRYRQRGVNFSENIELPALENMLGQQQRQLDLAVVEPPSRRSPARASRSLDRADLFINLPGTSTGPGAAAELQSQMPWAYIPSSSNRMRDQLPADEDLPPVPLPDYTAFQSARKASVHRAASSLSSMTQKKEYLPYQSQRHVGQRGTPVRLAPTLPAPPSPSPPLPPPPPPPPLLRPRRPRRPHHRRHPRVSLNITEFIFNNACIVRVLCLLIIIGLFYAIVKYGVLRNY